MKTLPVVDDGPADAHSRAQGRREDTIRMNVLAALGRPGDLYRVAVVALWGDHFRVNVVTGADPTLVRIPHSYFVAADGRGNIVHAAPPILRLY
jgi:hypothetical protein